MKISCMGCGYVGLVTGTCLSDLGNEVICYDIDKSKISKLKRKIMPIYEPGLKDMFDRNVKEERLYFSNDIRKTIRNSKVIYIDPFNIKEGMDKASAEALKASIEAAGGKVTLK